MEKITVKKLKDLLRKYKCSHERCTIRLSQRKAGLIAQAKKHKLMPKSTKAPKAAPKKAPKKARKRRKAKIPEPEPEPQEEEEEAPKPKPKKRRKKKPAPAGPPRRSSRKGRKKVDYSGMGG
jgi:hypothetical protein